MQLIQDDTVPGTETREDDDVRALGFTQGDRTSLGAITRADDEDGTSGRSLDERKLRHEGGVLGLTPSDADSDELASKQTTIGVGEMGAELHRSKTGVYLGRSEVDFSADGIRRAVRQQERDLGALGGLGPSGEETTEIILGKAEARPDRVRAHNGGKQAVRPGWSDQSAFGAEATTGDTGDRRAHLTVIQVELSEAGLRGGGGARTLCGGGQSLSIIGFLTTRSLLTEKLGLTDCFVGRLLCPRGFLRELRHGQRMGGDIGRRIDAEQEIAGFHLGALGVINRLQDTRHAGADFHLAHAFGLRR